MKALAITALRITLQTKPFYACLHLPGRGIADLWLGSLRPPRATHPPVQSELSHTQQGMNRTIKEATPRLTRTT